MMKGSHLSNLSDRYIKFQYTFSLWQYKLPSCHLAATSGAGLSRSLLLIRKQAPAGVSKNSGLYGHLDLHYLVAARRRGTVQTRFGWNDKQRM